MMGMVYFELLADFDFNPLSAGNNTYYVWNKACFLMLALSCIFPVKKMRYLFYTLASLSFFRLLYEIPAIRDSQWISDNYVMLFITVIHLCVLIALFFIEAIVENEKSHIEEMEKQLRKQDEENNKYSFLTKIYTK